LGEYFKKKTPRGFPTWHGLTHETLVKTIESGRVFKNATSPFLHGDVLMSIVAMACSPDGDWTPKLFAPLLLDVRVPLAMSM
jgi:hypothetical protein